MRREQPPLGLTTRDKPPKLGIFTPRVFFCPHSELSPRPRSCPPGEKNAAYTDSDVKKLKYTKVHGQNAMWQQGGSFFKVSIRAPPSHGRVCRAVGGEGEAWRGRRCVLLCLQHQQWHLSPTTTLIVSDTDNEETRGTRLQSNEQDRFDFYNTVIWAAVKRERGREKETPRIILVFPSLLLRPVRAPLFTWLRATTANGDVNV